jgi:hypothetical protein
MSETAPLTPADCDLRGLPFMQLDTGRLLDSDLFALSTGDEFKAAIALWCKAWQQIPAASLPDDDRVLAHLSGAGTRWKKLKPVALRGFVLCNDGRLYHPVIAEKANEAWSRRTDWQERQSNKLDRQQRWRARVKEISDGLRAAGITPPPGASLATLERLLVDAQASTGDANVDAMETREGRDVDWLERERERESSKKQSSVAKATGTASVPGADPPDVKKAAETHLWDAGKRFLQSRGVSKAQSGSVVGKWKGAYGTAPVIEALGVAQREPDLVDPIPFIEKILRRRSGTDDHGANTIGGVRMSSPC